MFTGCSPSSTEDETILSSPFHAQGSVLPLLHYHFGTSLLETAHLLSALVPEHSLPPLAWPLLLGQLPAPESSGGELIISLSHPHPHRGQQGPCMPFPMTPLLQGFQEQG